MNLATIIAFSGAKINGGDLISYFFHYKNGRRIVLVQIMFCIWSLEHMGLGLIYTWTTWTLFDTFSMVSVGMYCYPQDLHIESFVKNQTEIILHTLLL